MSEVLLQSGQVSSHGSLGKLGTLDRALGQGHHRARARDHKAMPAGGAAPLPASLIKAFNTWAFKREQPDGIEHAERAAAAAIAERRALPFVLYWGKGPRNEIAAPDLICLDYLASLADRVRQSYAPGAAIHLIFTDTHAALNGHPAQAQDAYFGAVAEAAAMRGFTTSRLGAVVAAASPAMEAEVCEEPTEEVRESLMACAAKWFRGEGSVERGALEYYRMNMIEKRAVSTVFPDAVFVTFNGSDFRALFPENMPIFYMYSLRRGFSVKPWFLGHEPSDVLQAVKPAQLVGAI